MAAEPETSRPADGALPAARNARERPRSAIGRAAVVAWYLGAGYFLFVAPWSTRIWNEALHAWQPRLNEALMTHGARLGVSIFGVILLLAAVVEVATWKGPGTAP